MNISIRPPLILTSSTAYGALPQGTPIEKVKNGGDVEINNLMAYFKDLRLDALSLSTLVNNMLGAVYV